MNDGAPPAELSEANATAALAARLDRLPFSAWHARSVGVIGLAHFFDAFDALTISFVLPLLAVQWKMTPQDVGLLIAAGYAGQMIGALAFGRAAESIGRLRALALAVGVMACLSLASAMATGAVMLMIFRFVQGLGLGGEAPVAATYINEICPGRLRGRVVFTLQALFASGVLVTAVAALWLIPLFGWRALFVIGGLPIILPLILTRFLDESPRWLAQRGRTAEAAAILDRVEQGLVARGIILATPIPRTVAAAPGGATLGALLRGGYAVRTISVWAIAFCISIAGYGIVSWMPTLYRTVYHLPLDQALRYGVATIVASFTGAIVAIPLIDLLGRRWSFIIGFVGGGLPLLYLGLTGAGISAFEVMLLSSGAASLLAFILAGIYVYAPEIYPTRMRALGAGAASAWLRVGSVVGPIAVGWLLPRTGIGGAFFLFGGAALAGALIMALFGIETKGRSLETIAP